MSVRTDLASHAVDETGFVDALAIVSGDEPDDIIRSMSDPRSRGLGVARAALAAGFPLSSMRLATWLQRGFPVISLMNSDPSLATAIPATIARRHRVYAVRKDGETFMVASADPEDLAAQDAVRRIFRSFKLAAADPAEIAEAIRNSERTEALAKVGAEANTRASERVAADLALGLGDDELVEGSVGKLLAETIRQALIAGASDIHFEPTETHYAVRIRIDSVLHLLDTHPITLAPQIMGRLKVLAGLDLGERRIPQDGRFQTTMDERTIDMRIATVPTTWGVEGAVIRLLDRGARVAGLPELGFSRTAMEAYERLWRSSTGAILVTGPTGSGKTSTLYATISAVADPTVKVLTIEDPVEFRFEGITQVQVNPKAGLTYSTALRSFLRCDPDIILVGEVRDHETATTMVEAALTGHLVFGTIHTNSAAATPIRLTEMGVDGYLIASALRGVVAQRLVRKLCGDCRENYHPSIDVLKAMGWQGPAPDILYRAREKGCANCSRTGFKGRVAVAEVLVIDEEIEGFIANNKPSEDLARFAVERGMVTMRADGLSKVANGITSLAELARVLGGSAG